MNQGKVFGSLVTGLLKAFDCVKHDLFLTKLQAHGFDNISKTGSKGLKSNKNLVHSKKYYLVLHKVL